MERWRDIAPIIDLKQGLQSTNKGILDKMLSSIFLEYMYKGIRA